MVQLGGKIFEMTVIASPDKIQSLFDTSLELLREKVKKKDLPKSKRCAKFSCRCRT